MSLSAAIPRAVQLVIDDVGWREGWSLAESDGPWRAGVNRLLEPEDYLAIAELGKRVGMRPQAACVLCEWDTENVCASCPTSTQAGERWDNSSRVGPWLYEVAEVFRGHADSLELALHGVGHEHWEDGVRTRAEWYGAQEGRRWDWDALLGHLTTFTAILDQHGLGPADGHRFPVSAVPCAFNYYFDAADAQSTGALLSQAGVQQVSTPFGGGFARHSALDAPDGGHEHGLVVLDRGSSGIPYDVFDTIPALPTSNSICGIHWPNLLAPEPEDNGQAVACWAGYLGAIRREPDMMVAANSSECFTQWAYHTFCTVTCRGSALEIDATGLPEAALRTAGRGPMWVKVPLREGDHISAIEGGCAAPVAYLRHEGFALIALQGLAGRRATVELGVGSEPPPCTATQRGTCNVLGICDTLTETVVELEVFGRQEIALRLRRPPASVLCSTPRVRVESVRFDEGTMTCSLGLRGHDIQGETAQVSLGHALGGG